jgi:hypothetical protein
MKPHHYHKIIFSTLLFTVLVGLSACSSTRSENGVTIEQNRSLNPLNYVPGL